MQISGDDTHIDKQPGAHSAPPSLIKVPRVHCTRTPHTLPGEAGDSLQFFLV